MTSQLLHPGNHALVITTDAGLATQIQSTLSAISVSCVVAESMFQAAQVIEKLARPAIILLDLSAEQSLKFISEIKSHATFSQIPLLAVTDDPSMPEVAAAIKAGANRWITKAFIATSLLTVVRQFAMH
jgi:DNA-binding response OmpR family regulator